MISVELVLYCLVVAGLYLLVLSALLEFIGKKLGIPRGIPTELLEPIGVSWFLLSYVMELLFFVIIPTFAYSFFYVIVPLSGIRAGMAGALSAFTLGAVPALMGLSVRIKLSMLYLLYFLLGLLLKMGGTLTIIGYLYSL
ncbi:MAG: hypothetical protein ACE5K8_01265 [Candidatus Zixiibacteriota bacterium]